MNIITGFFCNNALDMSSKDKAQKIATQKRNKHKYLADFQDVFKGLDEDHSGDITLNELVDNLEDPNIQLYFSHLNLEVSSAFDIFQLLDVDESGSISVEEFVLGCL